MKFKSIGSNKIDFSIEIFLLTDEEKIKACHISKQAGADFIKTSTGFSTYGATSQDVVLLRKTVRDEKSLFIIEKIDPL